MVTKGEHKDDPKCECRVVYLANKDDYYTETKIEYCPLHKAAPDLYKALELTQNMLGSIALEDDELQAERSEVMTLAAEALTKAEGKK